MLRIGSCIFVAVWLILNPVAVLADEAEQPSHTKIDISADRIAYYADESMVEAQGNVRVELSDGVAVQGDACVVNLSLRRFVVAGHVTLSTPAAQYSGAAFADFLAFRRAYFIPLSGEPDRWTFLNDDYATPEKGRQMPGDAFFLPDFSATEPFIIGKRVHIDPENFIQFFPARFVFFNGSIQTPSLPTYVRNFSDNQNFSVNALSGATYDLPYGVAASGQSLETLHFRYDQQKQTYGSFEHHSVFGPTGYVVFSLNPATQPAKQWNLLSYIGHGYNALSLNAQVFTYQYGLSTPLSSNGFIDLQDTQALRGSSVRLEFTQVYDSFLARPSNGAFYGDPSHPYTPNHPNVLGATWFGFDKQLFKTGWSYRLTSGVSALHDAFGLITPAKKNATSQYLGALLYTPVYPAPLGTGINASYQIQRTWLSFPNRIDTQTLTLSDSKRVSSRLSLTLSYLLQSAYTYNLNALYASPSAAVGLASEPISSNGLPIIAGIPSLYSNVRNTAFELTAAWAPSPNFQFTTLAEVNHYAPVQQPFVGGPPRYELLGDMRTRLSKTLFLDVSRTYFFNWGQQTWSPRFVLQVSAQ